jgi:hypothetical protein
MYTPKIRPCPKTPTFIIFSYHHINSILTPVSYMESAGDSVMVYTSAESRRTRSLECAYPATLAPKSTISAFFHLTTPLYGLTAVEVVTVGIATLIVGFSVTEAPAVTACEVLTLGITTEGVRLSETPEPAVTACDVATLGAGTVDVNRNDISPAASKSWTR